MFLHRFGDLNKPITSACAVVVNLNENGTLVSISTNRFLKLAANTMNHLFSCCVRSELVTSIFSLASCKLKVFFHKGHRCTEQRNLCSKVDGAGWSLKTQPGGISLPSWASMSSSSWDRKWCVETIYPSTWHSKKKIPRADDDFLKKIGKAHLHSSPTHWTYPLFSFLLYRISTVFRVPLVKHSLQKCSFRGHPEYLKGKLHSPSASHTWWSFQLVLFEINLQALPLLHTKHRGEKWPVSLGSN